jgi:uncharacterized protein (TIGR04255 family)
LIQELVGQAVPGLKIGRRYTNAPITQAILEFRTTVPVAVPDRVLAELAFGDDYQLPRPIYNLRSEVAVAEGGDGEPTVDTEHTRVGYHYDRHDHSRSIHVANDHFTFIWLANYIDWPAFLGEAETAWLRFREAVEPVTVDLVATRFINEIALPDEPVELNDYLRVAVDVPAYLPQSINRMFIQFDVPLTRLGCEVTITAALLDPTPDRIGGGLLLDADVKAPLGVATTDEHFNDSLQATLDRLRIAKNYVFEACITDATRRLID